MCVCVKQNLLNSVKYINEEKIFWLRLKLTRIFKPD